MEKGFKEFEKIKGFLDLLRDKLEALERKIDRLTRRQNCMDGDELLDTQDLCLLLKTSKRTLARYRKNGLLPFHNLEGKVYYKLSDIHEFIRKSFNPAKGKNSG
jgi:DNA-binding transcriptional MerR regulator